MSPVLLMVSTGFSRNPAKLYRHMDACLEGAGRACLKVAQKLPAKDDGTPSWTSHTWAGEGCAAGHQESCEVLFQAFDGERLGSLPPEPLMYACHHGNDSACDWLVSNIPTGLLVRRFDDYTEQLGMQDIAPEALQPRPSGPVTEVRRLSSSQSGTLIRSGAAPVTVSQVWLERHGDATRPPSTVLLDDPVVRTARHGWMGGRHQGWWDPTTGQRRELPDWCAQALECTPDDPPWWVGPIEGLQAAHRKHRILPIGEHIWVVPISTSSKGTRGPALIIGRDGQQTELSVSGAVIPVSDDLVVAVHEGEAHAHHSSGAVRWRSPIPIGGGAALSPSGKILAVGANLIDPHTGEVLYTSMLDCQVPVWSTSGALWCNSRLNLTEFKVQGAGSQQGPSVIPPGGWQSYGQITGQFPAGHALTLRVPSTRQSKVLATDDEGRFELWLPESEAGENISLTVVTGEGEDALSYGLGLRGPKPGESIHFAPPMGMVKVDFPGCVEEMSVRSSVNGAFEGRGSHVTTDCSVSIGPLLVGSRLSLKARDRLGPWAARATVAHYTAVAAERSPPPQEVTEPTSEDGTVPVHVLLPDALPQDTAVLFRRPGHLLVEKHFIELDPLSREYVDLAGRLTVMLQPGQWTVWAISPDGRSASLPLDTQGEIVTLPVPERPPAAMVRVVDAEGLPETWQGANMGWGDAEEHTNSNESVLKADRAGRIFVPDVGEALLLEGGGWEAWVEPGDSQVLNRGAESR